MKLTLVISSLLFCSTLFAQNVNVSFDEHKVLWRGYENKISLGSGENLTIEADKDVTIKSLGENKYTIKPTSNCNSDSTTIFVKNNNGEIILKEVYPIHSLPKPSIKVYGDYKGGYYIGRKVSNVVVANDYFNLDVKYSILSFKLFIYTWGSTKDTVKIEGDNLLETLTNVCDTLNVDMAELDIVAKVINHNYGMVMMVAGKKMFRPETIYHPNGKIAVKKTFDEYGIASGEFEHYYDNGQLWKKEHWINELKDDKCDNHYLTQYHPNGKILIEYKCLKDGTVQFTRYYDNGKKEKEGAMSSIDGWYIGKIKRYNNKGKLTCTNVFDKDGSWLRSKGDCE